MQGAKQVVLYGTASLLAAVVLFGLLFYLPRRAALQQVDTVADASARMTTALEQSGQALAAAPDPATIKPAQSGSVTAYLSGLGSFITSSNAETVEEPEPITNRWRNGRIDGYNRVVGNQEFMSALRQANGTLERTNGFAEYHHDVMFALRNLLEYDPQADLNAEDPESLLASIRAAGVGIGRTIEKLQAQTYPDDTSLSSIIDMLQSLEATRSSYDTAIENGRLKGEEYQRFLREVGSAQSEILQNRQAYWETAIERLQPELRDSLETFRPYNTSLHNLSD